MKELLVQAYSQEKIVLPQGIGEIGAAGRTKY